MQSHQRLSSLFLSLSLSLSLLQPFQAHRGPSPSRGDTSLKSRQSFFLGKSTGKGEGGKEFVLYSEINRTKEIDDHSRFNLMQKNKRNKDTCNFLKKSSLKLSMTSISNLKCFYRVIHFCAAMIHVAKMDLFQVYKKSIRSTFLHVAVFFSFSFFFWDYRVNT